MSRPVPEPLRKRGLLEARDNLVPGQEVSLAGLFMQTFRPEIEARFSRPAVRVHADGGQLSGDGDAAAELA